MPYVSRVDCHRFCIVGIAFGFGPVGLFVLCKGDDVIEEQVIFLMQPLECLLDVLVPGNLLLPALLFGAAHGCVVIVVCQ